MTIGTDSAIHFFGTQDTLGTTTSAVTDTSFSDGTNDLTAWTNDDDAPEASVILSATFSVAPDAGSSVSLIARLVDIVSTDDQDVPDANFPHTFLGFFPINDVTSEQFISIDVNLPNTKSSQVYHFYIQNNGGQTISAGWDLRITPRTIGPHA